MDLAERAPLLRARRGERPDDDDPVPSASAPESSAPDGFSSAQHPSSARRRGRYARSLAVTACVVMGATLIVSVVTSFVRAASAGMRAPRTRARAVGVAPRAREVLREEALRQYAWLVDAREDGGGGGVETGKLGRNERARTGRRTSGYEEEDPLEGELARNAHALDRARTVEDFVAMSVHVDDAHAVGRKYLQSWAHKPAWVGEPALAAKAVGSNLEYGDEAFTVCLYNMHQWTRPLGTSTWAEDLSVVLDAKRGVRSAATANLMGRCVKQVLHTNGRSDAQCMNADVIVFRGDTMVKAASAKLGKLRMEDREKQTSTPLSKLGSVRRALAPHAKPTTPAPHAKSTPAPHTKTTPAATTTWTENLVTHLPQKRRREQVYVYVSTAAPASVQAGSDLRDRALLSQVDYLASSNPALESVWRSPLPSAKLMISSYDAFIRPWNMRLPVIGFGDSATACKHGHSVGSHILRRISQKWPVWSHGTCMHNYNSSTFIPNLGQSMSSAEAIRVQLDLSRYLFYFVAEEVDCPGHVTEKLWLPLLRGSIPIYFGTKTVDDYLPCPNKDCVLRVKDFNSVDDLVDRMKEIASDPELYASLTQWRRQVPSLWPEKFRQGVARSSRDIQGIVCDIMRDGDDAHRRGSISNFASAAPAEAPWLLDSYPNKDIDIAAVESLERTGERSDTYCVRQERVRALGQAFIDAPSEVTGAETSAPRLADPNALFASTCDADYVGCGRLLVGAR